MKRLSFLIVSLLYIFLIFYRPAPKSIADHFDFLSKSERKNLGKDYFKLSKSFGRTSEKYKLYQDTAFALYPDASEEWSNKAYWHARIGEPTKALQALEKAFETDEETPLNTSISIKMYYLRDYRAALKDMAKVDSLTPNLMDVISSENLFHLMGLAHYQLAEYDKSIAKFDSLINYENLHGAGEEWIDVYSFFYLARAHQKKGDLNKALETYEKMINYCDNCPEAFYYRAFIYIKQNDNHLACEDFNKALVLLKKGYGKAFGHIEIIDQLYIEEVEMSLEKYCKTKK